MRLRAWLRLLLCATNPRLSWLSPGLDFESKLFAKPDAPRLLERELSEPNYSPRMIAIGTILTRISDRAAASDHAAYP